MYPELQALIHEAEHKYLEVDDLETLSSHVSTLRDRLSAYQIIRDQEINVFQKVADKLLKSFGEENTKKIETAIRHWLSVNRYCAMAMLLNNHEFLEHRILEWLTDIVQAYNLSEIENSLYSILVKELNTILSDVQMGYFEPFLTQAKNSLVNAKSLTN